MNLDIVKIADTEAVEDPADRATMRQVDEEATNRLHAEQLVWHLSMIRCASDPLEMVRILTCLGDPLPPVYLRTAHDEIMRRRAAHQRRERAIDRLCNPATTADADADADAPMRH
jgi:hypothetical protein